MKRKLRALAVAILLVGGTSCVNGCAASDADTQESAAPETSASARGTEVLDSDVDYATMNFEGYSFECPSDWGQGESPEDAMIVFSPQSETFVYLAVMDLPDDLKGPAVSRQLLDDYAIQFAKGAADATAPMPEVKEYELGGMTGYLFYLTLTQSGNPYEARTFLTIQDDMCAAWTLANVDDADILSGVFESLHKTEEWDAGPAAEATSAGSQDVGVEPVETFAGVNFNLPLDWNLTQDSDGNADIRTYRASDNSGYVAIDRIDIGDDLIEAYRLTGDMVEATSMVLDSWIAVVEDEIGAYGMVSMDIDGHEARVGNIGESGMCILSVADGSHLVVFVANGGMDTVDSIIDSVTFANSTSSIEASL